VPSTDAIVRRKLPTRSLLARDKDDDDDDARVVARPPPPPPPDPDFGQSLPVQRHRLSASALAIDSSLTTSSSLETLVPISSTLSMSFRCVLAVEGDMRGRREDRRTRAERRGRGGEEGESIRA